MTQHSSADVFAPAPGNGLAGQYPDRFNALGIPVDNLTMAETCDRIVDLVYRYPRERKANYVATVNVDFMVNALGVAGAEARHPELLEVLRSSALVTADGFPVVLLSKLMGRPLRERVTGADLVPALAERAAAEGLRLYLFGGREEIARQAANTLERRYPGLEIAGVESPMVHTQGEALLRFEADDERIINDINRSGADILLIGLGNPKQEQWFRRHQDRLKVPVSVGIGGTFEFIAGSVKRAPDWLQRYHLEWLFRISQDPARLWKRYAEGLIKLGLLVAPTLWMRGRELLLGALPKGGSVGLKWTQFSGPNQARAVTVLLPRVLGDAEVLEILAQMDGCQRRDTLFLLDFSLTRRVDTGAMQALFELGRRIATGASRGVYVSMHKRVRRQLANWRLLDLFARDRLSVDNLHAPLASQQLRGVALRFYTTERSLVVYLHGDIDGEMLRNGGLESVLAMAEENQRCIVDLRFTNLVESSAVAEFYRIAAGFDGNQLCFAGVSSGVRRMFRLAKIPRPLWFVSDAVQHQLMVAV